VPTILPIKITYQFQARFSKHPPQHNAKKITPPANTTRGILIEQVFIIKIQDNPPEAPLQFKNKAFPAPPVTGAVIGHVPVHQVEGHLPAVVISTLEAVGIEMVEIIEVFKIEAAPGQVARQQNVREEP
jgi:hypothetical protein